MYILINVIYTIAALKWGDWRNWKQYHPTILFYCIGDFLYNFILYNKPMWLFRDLILPNHTLAEEIYVDSCGRKGIGETPQCVSTRRLTSRPRKAKCISGAVYIHQSKFQVRIFL